MLTPFVISDFRAGIFEDKEPWQSPEDSFREAVNAKLFRGRMVRRNGYTKWGTLGTGQEETPGTGNALGTAGSPYSEALTSVPVVPADGTYTVVIADTATHTGANAVKDDPAQVSADGTAGVLVHAVDGNVGTIDYITGDIIVNGLSVAFDSNVTINYEYRRLTVSGGVEPENMVMGIANFFAADGGENLLAFDRRRYWKWVSADSRFEDVEDAASPPGQDVFTCEPDSFFFWAAFEDRLAVVNDTDQPFYYDAAADVWKQIHVDWNNPAVAQDDLDGTGGDVSYTPEIRSAKVCVRFRNRLVLLSTKEGAGSDPHRRRARWSEPIPNFDSGDSWDPNGWKDCPTDGLIVAARVYKEDLIVLFSNGEIWRLAPIDDVINPFDWERLSEDTIGARSPRGILPRGNQIIYVAATDILEWDGAREKSAIPGFRNRPQLWFSSAMRYSYAEKIEESRQSIFSYEPLSSSGKYPSRAIVVMEDSPITEYEYPFHVYGRYSSASSVAWDDIVDAWDDIAYSFDSVTPIEGTPALLGGDRAMFVHQLDVTQQDNGADFEWKIATQRLNPFMQSARDGRPGSWYSSRVAYLDVVFEVGGQVEVTFSAMANFSDAPYVTKQFTLTPSGGGSEKIVKRIVVNRLADLHKFEFKGTAPVAIAIEAICMWARKGARVRETRV